MLDRFDCYELCVQSPPHVVAFLRAAHGHGPVVLREEFCGSAAVSRRWAEEMRKHDARARAVAIDLDTDVLVAARQRAQEAGVADALDFVHDDCINPTRTPNPGGRGPSADVIFVGNFSIGYIHRRTDLVGYLSRARETLLGGRDGSARGIFACDTYGGAGAFRLGGTLRRRPGPAREAIHYHWVHEKADPITAMVENTIGFRVEVDGEVVSDLPRAFVYRWRLWSIAELREAMLEVGFNTVEVYKDVNIVPGAGVRPVEDAPELGEDWIVLVVGRV